MLKQAAVRSELAEDIRHPRFSVGGVVRHPRPAPRIAPRRVAQRRRARRATEKTPRAKRRETPPRDHLTAALSVLAAAEPPPL
jgi:hypothetical protein